MPAIAIAIAVGLLAGGLLGNFTSNPKNRKNLPSWTQGVVDKYVSKAGGGGGGGGSPAGVIGNIAQQVAQAAQSLGSTVSTAASPAVAAAGATVSGVPAVLSGGTASGSSGPGFSVGYLTAQPGGYTGPAINPAYSVPIGGLAPSYAAAPGSNPGTTQF